MSRFEKIYGMDIPHRAIAIYGYLYDRANENGECWPAIPTIAKDIKLSIQTVRRAVRDLERSHLLMTEQRYRSKGGKSSRLYRIL